MPNTTYLGKQQAQGSEIMTRSLRPQENQTDQNTSLDIDEYHAILCDNCSDTFTLSGIYGATKTNHRRFSH